ncbi:GNAT family N-acetyltransferase [Paenibacillus psychroresistens]|uniref:GNAT family N-acetyltransferase n=1 Tax=Paenibacillus psychroresistens TaxID=1778678 RepID=A0A6B8RTQ4_9BACL|nr:GNAT family N-acetyltransferase [Paenibacillus psychroresistens]QGQ99184.1 GNAT family N-acetyltransferase [Paenibacillus psychroresistens]
MVIDGSNPGWIFVDQIVLPNSALVWSKGIQGFYLIGDHTDQTFINTLDVYITSNIVPRMRELGLDHFEVSGHHNKWDLKSIFASRNLHQFEQMVLKLFRKPPVSNAMGFKTINLRLQEWERQELIHIEFVKENIDLFWSSKDDFLRKGYGFAAIDGLEIIGLSYSSFVTEDTHAIGIETLPQYKNKGVGTHLATLLAEDILAMAFHYKHLKK